MAEDQPVESYSDSSESEPKPGPSGVVFKDIKPKHQSDDDSSTSESDIGAFSEQFNPMKALYSDRIMLLVHDAPMYENLQQFESALKNQQVLPVGRSAEVKLREEKKIAEKLAYETAVEEKNRLRFAKYEAPVKPARKAGKNVFTRQESTSGPLAALKRCMDMDLKVKVMIRGPVGIRGHLYGSVVAYDKHWNLALTDVLEVYRRKATKKLKIPPAGGRPVAKGTADFISPVPAVVETPIGGKVWECARHIPQIMVRGEHVVTINIIEQ